MSSPRNFSAQRPGARPPEEEEQVEVPALASDEEALRSKSFDALDVFRYQTERPFEIESTGAHAA